MQLFAWSSGSAGRPPTLGHCSYDRVSNAGLITMDSYQVVKFSLACFLCSDQRSQVPAECSAAHHGSAQ